MASDAVYLLKKYLPCECMNIGEAIKSIRIKIGLTQEQLCDRVNLTQGFYSSIENADAHPSIDSLERICNAFNVPVLFIIWLATDKKKLSKSARLFFNTIDPLMITVLNKLISNQHAIERKD